MIKADQIWKKVPIVCIIKTQNVLDSGDEFIMLTRTAYKVANVHFIFYFVAFFADAHIFS